MFRYPLVCLSACALSFLFIRLLKTFSLKQKILLKENIPLTGGIGMGLSFALVSLAAFLSSGPLGRNTAAIILSSGFMLAFGVIDDWRELSVIGKIIAQLIAALTLVFCGVKTQIFFLGDFLNIAVTLVWILAITNAVNHLDVLDGAAGVTAAFAAIAYFLVALSRADGTSAVLAAALAGALAGFLAFNLPPAKVYMGNGGSHFLGFLLGALALNLSFAPSVERKLSLLAPILILGFIIFDSAFLVWMRLKQGRSIFKKSEDHLALRFLKNGLSRAQALAVISALALFFSLCGVVVSQAANIISISAVVLVALVALAFAFNMGKIKVDG